VTGHLDADHHRRILDEGRLRAGLTVDQLWLRYFALGGTVDVAETEAYLHGLRPLPPYQRDILAQAVNERLCELESIDTVPYTFDASP
jgi:hypothetical protein